ncbi:carbamoyl-phosphate synthase small subunit [Candidatus Pantoea edessiphila]|uniref:Carbamoyl phosphate synthase small chain n=1 Tax=Candidatus Pantoea edessiphila TaxID=2044610 RepID=A0A2P5SY44_9GAMM|nr:glutamine-hydrolyzing carbamoyl-phosphate synthase small subunit [Candidatus Pantoea edessiphila]MBK4775608.1 glutamine-hydrolyzing carbamoyl-phosphate synthase small subunit [Pantoea sp. Edef]PPI87256.1 carbamoyl-phosphate synthase small subunit [Candidatus Pantoea edessiphila]
MVKSALLVLEDGTQFFGRAIGAAGSTIGEIVFNTSMTGYQEILTDPSYFLQIILLTHPHIGNVGTNFEDEESNKIYASGLIIRDLSLLASNFRNQECLSKYLQRKNIIAISDIDTRKLTRIIRNKGTQNGCIITDNNLDCSVALQKIKYFIGLADKDISKEVTTSHIYNWNQGNVYINHDAAKQKNNRSIRYNVVVYDYGVKINILRILVDKGCYLTVVPAQTSAQEVMDMNPDGIVLSNGPGNPSLCKYAIDYIRYFLKIQIPIFGICFGHQLLAIANGAKITKMKAGHHGGNHPVKNLSNNKIMITAQNHCFVVDKTSLPNCLYVTHVSLFDDTIQGIHHFDKPAFSFQGHPEASPGPLDAMLLFDHFIELMDECCSKK